MVLKTMLVEKMIFKKKCYKNKNTFGFLALLRIISHDNIISQKVCNLSQKAVQIKLIENTFM